MALGLRLGIWSFRVRVSTLGFGDQEVEASGLAEFDFQGIFRFEVGRRMHVPQGLPRGL